MEWGVCVPQAKKVFRAVSVRGGDSAGVTHAADLEVS